MSWTTCSTGRQLTLPSSISRERRSMTSFHCVSASASTVLSRLAMSCRARNARSCSGKASTSATLSAAMLMRPKYRRLRAFWQEFIVCSVVPVDDNGGRAQAPPQRLALVFSTADVEVLGWRLATLADKLHENNLAAVRALSKRYAEVDRHMPFVASITITPIAKG